MFTYMRIHQSKGVCQPGKMYNVQKAKAEKGKHWLQKLHPDDTKVASYNAQMKKVCPAALKGLVQL